MAAAALARRARWLFMPPSAALALCAMLTACVLACGGWGATPAYATSTADFEVEDGTITAYTGEEADVVIPEGIASAVGLRAFSGNSAIRTVKLPGGVESIRTAAFEGCTSLESVDLSACSSLTRVGAWAFKKLFTKKLCGK